MYNSDEQALHEDFVQYYEGFHANNRSIGAVVDYIDDIWGLHAKATEKSVLDVGCGPGEHLHEFDQMGWTITGVDTSESMIDVAGNRLPPEVLYQGDMRSLESVDREFGLVTCLYNTIGYNTTLADLENTIEAFSNKLVPGGVVYFDLVLSKELGLEPFTNCTVERSDTGPGSAVRIGRIRQDGSSNAVGEYVIVASEDDTLEYTRDIHRFGVFSLDTVTDYLRKHGFEPYTYNALTTNRFDGSRVPVVVGVLTG